jgi:hypothetical protein
MAAPATATSITDWHAQERARRQAQTARWHRRVNEWPLAIRCPLGDGVARRVDAGNSGMRYQCDTCGVLLVVPTAQVDKRGIRKALRLGPVPK